MHHSVAWGRAARVLIGMTAQRQMHALVAALLEDCGCLWPIRWDETKDMATSIDVLAA
jgi:hypothetical protein